MNVLLMSPGCVRCNASFLDKSIRGIMTVEEKGQEALACNYCYFGYYINLEENVA